MPNRRSDANPEEVQRAIKELEKLLTSSSDDESDNDHGEREACESSTNSAAAKLEPSQAEVNSASSSDSKGEPVAQFQPNDTATVSSDDPGHSLQVAIHQSLVEQKQRENTHNDAASKKSHDSASYGGLPEVPDDINASTSSGSDFPIFSNDDADDGLEPKPQQVITPSDLLRSAATSAAASAYPRNSSRHALNRAGTLAALPTSDANDDNNNMTPVHTPIRRARTLKFIAVDPEQLLEATLANHGIQLRNDESASDDAYSSSSFLEEQQPTTDMNDLLAELTADIAAAPNTDIYAEVNMDELLLFLAAVKEIEKGQKRDENNFSLSRRYDWEDYQSKSEFLDRTPSERQALLAQKERFEANLTSAKMAAKRNASKIAQDRSQYNPDTTLMFERAIEVAEQYVIDINNQIIPKEAIAYRISSDRERFLKVQFLLVKLHSFLSQRKQPNSVLRAQRKAQKKEAKMRKLQGNTPISHATQMKIDRLRKAIQEIRTSQGIQVNTEQVVAEAEQRLAEVQRDENILLYQLERVLNNVPDFLVHKHDVDNYYKLIKLEHRQINDLKMSRNQKQELADLRRDFLKLSKRALRDLKVEIKQLEKEIKGQGKANEDVDNNNDILNNKLKVSKGYYKSAKQYYQTRRHHAIANDCSVLSVEYIGGGNHPYLTITDEFTGTKLGYRTGQVFLDTRPEHFASTDPRPTTPHHARAHLIEENATLASSLLIDQVFVMSLGLVSDLHNYPVINQYAHGLPEPRAIWINQACAHCPNNNMLTRTKKIHKGQFSNKIAFFSESTKQLFEAYIRYQHTPGADPSNLDLLRRAINLADANDIMLDIITRFKDMLASGCIMTDLKLENLFIMPVSVIDNQQIKSEETQLVERIVVFGDPKSGYGPIQDNDGVYIPLDRENTNEGHYLECSPSHVFGPKTMWEIVLQECFSSYYQAIFARTPTTISTEFARNAIDWRGALSRLCDSHQEEIFDSFRKEIIGIFEHYHIANGGQADSDAQSKPKAAAAAKVKRPVYERKDSSARMLDTFGLRSKKSKSKDRSKRVAEYNGGSLDYFADSLERCQERLIANVNSALGQWLSQNSSASAIRGSEDSQDSPMVRRRA